MIAAGWVLFGCGGQTGTMVVADVGLPNLDLPDPLDLPVVEDPPDAWVSWVDGSAVTDWSERRSELLVLFHHYIYGWSADAQLAADVDLFADDALDGGRLLQHRGVAVGPAGEEQAFVVALWLPDGDGPFPVVLGLNKCGNATVSAQPEVVDGGAWQEDGCDPTPGSRSSYWNVEASLAAGVGVATVHQSDFAPDDALQTGGMLGWELPRASANDRWGTLGIWAYGLSRTVDVLETVPEVGPIIAMGHSRRGKTALWAAAQDGRIDAVWAHQSGTGGAALTRNVEGETVAAVNGLFPQWFNDVFPKFAGEEPRLPVDQHLLLALVAPRPLRVTDGADDFWADPVGAELSVGLAKPVFERLGGEEPVWALRPGGHEVLPEDWVGMLEWMGGWL